MRGFAGRAGEVVRGFLSLPTMVVAGPLAVLMAALLAGGLYALAGVLHLLPKFLVLLVWGILVAPVTARFALRELHGAAPVGAVLAASGRYAVATLLWGTPWSLLLSWTARGEGLAAALTLLGMGPSMGARALASFFLLLASLILVPVGWIAALRSSSLRELFSWQLWSWIGSERRSDLVPLVAVLYGGLLLGYVAVYPPLILLTASVEPASETGIAILGFLWVVPAAGVPILLGRLCGAFLHEEALEGDDDRAPPAATRPEAGQLAGPLAPPPPGSTTSAAPEAVDLPKLLKAIRARAETDLAGSLAEAEALWLRTPHSAAVAAELARLYQASTRQDEALSMASQGIALALRSGAGALASALYEDLRQRRDALTLGGSDLEHLGKILLARQRFEDALWCCLASAGAGVPAPRVQKTLLAVGDAAARAGAPDRARAAYEAFLDRYPDSAFVDYCREALERARRRA